MTTSQIAFGQGLIQGKTYRQAYKDAYPNAQGSDSSITTSAYKLSRDPRIMAMVQDALDETVEHLAEDVAGTKRYVLKQLIAHSKGAKQEGTKLKALELLGKSVGLFIDKAEVKTETVTAEQLKRELGQHLKLLPSVKRSA
jgi:predicted transcriptional regulator